MLKLWVAGLPGSAPAATTAQVRTMSGPDGSPQYRSNLGKEHQVFNNEKACHLDKNCVPLQTLSCYSHLQVPAFTLGRLDGRIGDDSCGKTVLSACNGTPLVWLGSKQ